MKRSVNTIAGEIFVQVHKKGKVFKEKETNQGGKLGKYLDVWFVILKVHPLFITDRPGLESKVKYNSYCTFFEEYFDYVLGRLQIVICSSYRNRLTKIKEDSPLSHNAKMNAATELVVHKDMRCQEFYNQLKNIKDEKDENRVLLFFLVHAKLTLATYVLLILYTLKCFTCL